MSKFECACGCIDSLTEYPDCSKDRGKIRLRCEKERFRINDFTRQHDHKWRTYCWEKHRQRICLAKPVVDSKSPKFPPVVFTRHSTNYNKRLANFARIERENIILTQHIQKTFIEDSQIDNHLGPLVKCRRNRGFRRLTEQMKLAYENIAMAKRLTKITATPTYVKCNQLNWYAVQEQYMELKAKFPLYWRDVICKSYEAAAMAKASDGTKPQVYFDLEVKNEEIGRIVIELNPMAGPVAVEMIRIMFEGKHKNHRYKCSQLNKTWPGIGWLFGRGAPSVLKCPFPPKKYRMKHDQRGIFSLINNGHDLFEAEFMITAREMKPLDNRNLAIGIVTEGLEYLDGLSKHLFREGQVFRSPMYIVKTGEFDPNNPPPPPQMTRKCPSTAGFGTDDEVDAEEINITESEFFEPLDDEEAWEDTKM
ncbi:unnamed protein product [Allacma fusca]|uniref:PPIase cyclophilin-type domain-containing protein n=1 Tax=Allacma fusca TaxID=39272 RepID=A0A8J2PI70_9HEXA|nr:unnamed protein product [Allacma fusca]